MIFKQKLTAGFILPTTIVMTMVGAGIVFGLMFFKPQLTLVIAVTMLMKREWQFVLGMLSTATVFLSLSLTLGI